MHGSSFWIGGVEGDERIRGRLPYFLHAANRRHGKVARDLLPDSRVCSGGFRGMDMELKPRIESSVEDLCPEVGVLPSIKWFSIRHLNMLPRPAAATQATGNPADGSHGHYMEWNTTTGSLWLSLFSANY
ncbi:hypothetical protein BS78_K284500 [Paspalum vaginatum]|uniref:Uncharacterized protein n=1 Tax=Paspalum vaginatum TaxID=158149 RepID=A0A9W8CDB8_9POAL|nr:hypothetical protein BS78_K284500 [Paspalum vaginatum]